MNSIFVESKDMISSVTRFTLTSNLNNVGKCTVVGDLNNTMKTIFLSFWTRSLRVIKEKLYVYPIHAVKQFEISKNLNRKSFSLYWYNRLPLYIQVIQKKSYSQLFTYLRTVFNTIFLFFAFFMHFINLRNSRSFKFLIPCV